MTLEFGPRKTFSELLSELSRDVAASKLHDYVWALWRPVSSVVQLVPGLDLRDTIFDDWARQAGMVANLRRCTEYREMIEKGHGLSRGSPQSKVEAKWCFERALDLAGALRARGGLPISLALPMQSDAESRVASCDFYTGNYAFADDRLKSAQHSLDSAVGNNEFPTYGLVAQKVTIKQWQLIVKGMTYVRERGDISRFEQIVHDEFDTTTIQIRRGLVTGGEHSNKYVNPLSQWLNNRLDGPPLFGEDKTRGYKYSLERLDRQEFIVSCAKYLGNQAFIELLIYDITREPSYLQLCQNNNVLALDAEADGWGNIHFSDYKIQPGAADMYCHSHHYDSEMQIGLTRTSCYQLAAASVMGDQGDFQFIIERLSKLLDKDDSESTNVRNVINSALTAKRNLTECGMGHLWDGLEQVLPEQLKQRLSR